MAKPFDYIDAASHTKRDLIREDVDPARAEREYNAWLANRHFSMFEDSVFYANDMNLCPHLPPQLQFDYYLNTLRPRKRFGKWHKPDQDVILDAVQRRYGVNRARALEIARTLSRGELEAATRRTRVDELGGGKLRGGSPR